MGIEPTRDLISPTLALKTRGTTRHQSPPYIFPILSATIVMNPLCPVNEYMPRLKLAPLRVVKSASNIINIIVRFLSTQKRSFLPFRKIGFELGLFWVELGLNWLKLGLNWL